MLKLFMSVIKRVSTLLASPFRRFFSRIQRIFNINTITAKMTAPLNQKIKALVSLKPQAKSDYISIGRFWVYKKLFITLLFLICTGVFLYFTMIAAPIPKPSTEQVKIITDVLFRYDDIKLREFSGLANICADDGAVVYTGEIKSGICEGKGTLYSRKGEKLYEGEFAQNQYAGKGCAFYQKGGVRYEGEFSQNKFNGAGKQYDEQANLIYDGSFKDGLYDGDGKQYTEQGVLVYEGTFASGQFHGSGTNYYSDGTVQYQGEFFQGKAQGSGTLFSEKGKPVYTGQMYGGQISYRSLINTSLADLETTFSETPNIYYSDDKCCFVFEQAGVIASVDCRVKVDEWEKPKSDEERAEGFYYLPDSQTLTAGNNTFTVQQTAASSGGPRVRTLSAYVRGTVRVLPLSWTVDPGDGGSSSKEESSSEPSSSSSSSSSSSTASSSSKAAESSSSSLGQGENTIGPEESSSAASSGAEVPEFIDKKRTLYFEIDRNVWLTEEELNKPENKSKLLIKKLTVFGALDFPVDADGTEEIDNSPPDLEDCVAIDFARKDVPTLFSNVLFDVDRQNRLFVHVWNINYAARIVRRSYVRNGLQYSFCYPLNEPERMVYFTITN